MDDAIKLMYIWPFAWCNNINHTIHRHLFRNFSPFHLPVKEKGKQGRMKGVTMTQCINLNRNNRSVLAHWYSVLWDKIWPYPPTASGSYVRQEGRQAGWQTKYRIAQNFDGGKVWRNLTNEACQKVWWAKLWQIELGFVCAGKNKLLWNYNVLAKVENL